MAPVHSPPTPQPHGGRYVEADAAHVLHTAQPGLQQNSGHPLDPAFASDRSARGPRLRSVLPVRRVLLTGGAERYQEESRMLDSLEGVCPGQAQLEYPATSILFGNGRASNSAVLLRSHPLECQVQDGLPGPLRTSPVPGPQVHVGPPRHVEQHGRHLHRVHPPERPLGGAVPEESLERIGEQGVSEELPGSPVGGGATPAPTGGPRAPAG